MRLKDDTVQANFHPTLTSFLFWVDALYRAWQDENVITSGSEPTAKHSITSLHYAIPGQAADTRIWDQEFHNRGIVPNKSYQLAAIERLAAEFCIAHNIPTNWIDVVLESDHIHIEYQPKRQDDLIR